MGSTLRLDSGEVDRLLARPGIAQSEENSAVHASIVAWLAGQEREHAHLVLVADAEFSAWTRRCLRQADRILLVADARAAPTLAVLDQQLASMDLDARIELVLLHADGATSPSGTAGWLATPSVSSHHHVRLGDDRDLRRVARRVSGRAVGLVLGGGGARGFAHIGVLRALAESGIEVDVVGGTSIGSLIAGAHAAGVGVDTMMELARSFASPRKLLDRTLPVTSLMAGRKVTGLYQDLFGEVAIEDLWTPCFAVSSGLSRAEVVVHARGTMWKAIRASTAIPAIFPPMLHDDGEVLVDGNVMNNMPLDVMRDFCGGGTVIGVNPMPTTDKEKRYSFGPSLTGWEALKGRLRWFGSTTHAPSILGSVMRATEINSANRMRQPAFRALADLLVEPGLAAYPILAFDRFEEIIEIGYRSAREALDGWQPDSAAARPL
jgi:predicted acylesterase/phospholipase RssA